MRIWACSFVFLLLVLQYERCILSNAIASDQIISKIVSSWTVLDTVYSIAPFERTFLYQDVIKANLDLYSLIYWSTATPSIIQAMSIENVHQIAQILSDFLSAQQRMLAGSENGCSIEEVCMRYIAQHIGDVWNAFYRTLITPGGTDINSVHMGV